jgi:hypothetical protein
VAGDVRLSENITLNNGTISRNQLRPASARTDQWGFGIELVCERYLRRWDVHRQWQFNYRESRDAHRRSSDVPGAADRIMRWSYACRARRRRSTLTLFAANGTLSTVGGVPTGNLGNTSVSLRAPTQPSTERQRHAASRSDARDERTG